MTDNQLELLLELARVVVATAVIDPEALRVLDEMAEDEGRRVVLSRQLATQNQQRRSDGDGHLRDGHLHQVSSMT